MLWSTKLSIKEHKNLSLDPELTETLANHYERRALVEAVWTRQVALPVSLEAQGGSRSSLPCLLKDKLFSSGDSVRHSKGTVPPQP